MLRIDEDGDEINLFGAGGYLLLDKGEDFVAPAGGRKIVSYLAGSIHMFPGETLPDGFLMCNGAYYEQDDYPVLFAAIGTRYGSSSPTNFRVPQFGGYFPRFHSFLSGQDPDVNLRTNRGDGTLGNNVGTIQADANAQHTHPMVYGSLGGNGLPLKATPGGLYNTSTVGGTENRPLNINLMMVIKY